MRPVQFGTRGRCGATLGVVVPVIAYIVCTCAPTGSGAPKPDPSQEELAPGRQREWVAALINAGALNFLPCCISYDYIARLPTKQFPAMRNLVAIPNRLAALAGGEGTINIPPSGRDTRSV